MKTPRPAVVDGVRPGSAAAEAGVAPGDRIVRVNGRAPLDYIDYRFLTAETHVRLSVAGRNGRRHLLRLEKEVDEDLGIRFERDVFDGLRTCRNHCPFCFVDQLPAGLRPAVYVHDDDYRLSFLHGTYITLTNLTPSDLTRIARLHLSPLYVSVQATEPEVRASIFGRATGDVFLDMRNLIAKQIEFHCQIVVCPGINDGEHLARTVTDLASLDPGVRSIGLVPVGLTKHRRGLAPLRPVSPQQAEQLVRFVRSRQRAYLKELGSRLVFAADELYLAAQLPVPGRAVYEGFPQLANGIGGVRLFLDGLKRLRPLRLPRPLRATLVTGEAAAELVQALACKLETGGSVSAKVCVVENRLLGRSVNTAGLLAGRDVARALRRERTGDVVLVPKTAIREGEGFLDGMTTDELSKKVDASVLVAGSPREATAALRRHDRERVPR